MAHQQTSQPSTSTRDATPSRSSPAVHSAIQHRKDIIELLEDEEEENTVTPTPPAKPLKAGGKPRTKDSTNSPSTSSGPQTATSMAFGMFCIFNVVESLNLLGFNTFDKLETLLEVLLVNPAVVVQPLLLKLITFLKRFNDDDMTLVGMEYPNQESQLKFNLEEQSFEQISQIFKPLMNKSVYRDLIFSTGTVQSFLQYVRETPCVGNNRNTADSKNKYVKKIRKYETDSESAGSDIENDFLELFSNGKSKRSSSKTKIVQFLQLSTSDDRRKIETKGEVGRFIVRIEITDTKALKGVEPKNYWKRINKKVIFYCLQRKMH